MTEWGKALRPSVHDLIKQTNALDAKIDDIETLPIVTVDYDTENVEISATINKTYDELRTYAQGCIVHDAYFNDVTLGTVTVDSDFVQLVYGFSGIVNEAVTYNTITVTVNTDGTNEVVIGTDSFGGGEAFIINGEYNYQATDTKHSFNIDFNELSGAINDGKSIIIKLKITPSPNNYEYYYPEIDTSYSGQTIELRFFRFRYNGSNNTWSTFINVIVNVTSSITTVTEYVNKPFLPTASASTLGGVKVGDGLSIDGNGVLSASVSSGSNGITYAHLSGNPFQGFTLDITYSEILNIIRNVGTIVIVDSVQYANYPIYYYFDRIDSNDNSLLKFFNININSTNSVSLNTVKIDSANVITLDSKTL